MGTLVGIRGQVSKDRLFDVSGSITTGGTAQLILPEAHTRSSLIIENTSSGNLFLEFGAARAGLAVLSSNTISSVPVANAGFGYSIAPNVVFYGGAFGAAGNPQLQPAYSLQGLPDWTAPSKPAKAHCVMTGAAGSMTVSSIVIDDPGAGYAYPPFVFLFNSHNDPFGAAVPSATVGMELLPGGSYTPNGSVCTTDQVSVYGATTGQTFLCKFTL